MTLSYRQSSKSSSGDVIRKCNVDSELLDKPTDQIISSDLRRRLLLGTPPPSGEQPDNRMADNDADNGQQKSTHTGGSTAPPEHLDLTCSLPTRRKILPSADLLDDCSYSSDASESASSQPSRHKHAGRSGDQLPQQARGASATWTSLDNESVKTPDSLMTSDLLDDSVFDGELDWIDSRPSSAADTVRADSRQGSSRENNETSQHWSTVMISDKQYRIDLKVIEPYKRVLSHGGYYGDGYNAIIVITACYLPDNRRRDYHYVMRNLFLYVISTLELLVMDDYMIIYFHGAAPRQKMPSFRWLRQCYEMIDRRYKKKLKQLLIVHPTFFLRTIVLMTKPFISTKFYNKLQYVRSLDELRQLVPMDHVFVSDEIKQYDSRRLQQQQTK